MKRIALLGSTGSIGIQTAKVARHLGPERVRIDALAAFGGQLDLLEQQVREFRPQLVAVFDPAAASELRRRLGSLCEIAAGEEGMAAAATHPDVEFVVSAIAGAAGLLPTLKALECGKRVGLANKEALVAGGELVRAHLKNRPDALLPIDSEHSALWQCLNGEKKEQVRRLILTASGGPFRSYSSERLETVKPSEALGHPNWNMGAKVTVDSSTLMNKGLEVIEAHYLFDMPLDQIEVVVHPQSIVHSMVEFVDGTVMAQMSKPDMVAPIQYALTFPDRCPSLLEPLRFTSTLKLEFYPPDSEKFPCLRLAIEALRARGTAPCFLNAANEVLVERFLQCEIGWKEIGRKLEVLMQRHKPQPQSSIEAVLAEDAEGRRQARQI